MINPKNKAWRRKQKASEKIVVKNNIAYKGSKRNGLHKYEMVVIEGDNVVKVPESISDKLIRNSQRGNVKEYINKTVGFRRNTSLGSFHKVQISIVSERGEKLYQGVMESETSPRLMRRGKRIYKVQMACQGKEKKEEEARILFKGRRIRKGSPVKLVLNSGVVIKGYVQSIGQAGRIITVPPGDDGSISLPPGH